MESHSWSSEEEPLFLIENQMQDDKNNDFKYKLFWYNNFAVSIVTTSSLNPKLQNVEDFIQSKAGNNNSSKPVFWDSNCEAKGKDNDKIFKLSWDLINQKSNTKVLMLNCSKFEYITDGTQTMNCSFTVPHDDDHCFHDK